MRLIKSGGVESGATYQKGRGTMNKQNVVEHTHTTHTGDVKRATLATKQKLTESVCFLTQQTPWEKR